MSERLTPTQALDAVMTAVHALHGDLSPDHDAPWHAREDVWRMAEATLDAERRTALVAPDPLADHGFGHCPCTCCRGRWEIVSTTLRCNGGCGCTAGPRIAPIPAGLGVVFTAPTGDKP